MIRASINGVTVAETERTVIVEGNHYFPPTSVRFEHQPAEADVQRAAPPAAMGGADPGIGRRSSPARSRPRCRALNGGRGRGGDPPVINELVHLANAAHNRDHPPLSLRLDEPPTPVIATQMTVAGVPVIVVRSDHPFAMPDQGVPTTSRDDPWVARRGQVTLVCLNTPHPVLLAAVLPAGQLVALAYQLQQ